MEHCLWNSVVEQWNIVGATVWWNSVGGKVKVERWNNDGVTVWWYSGIVLVD